MNLVCGVLVLAIYPDDESATPQAQYGATPAVPFVPADDPTFTAVLGLPVSGPPANWMPPGIDRQILPGTGAHSQAKGQILGYNDRDYIHVASPSDPGKTMCLEVRARYGEDAGRMIGGLRDELLRMGVDLYEPETGSSAGARGGHPSLVEARAGTPTGSLGDAVTNAEVTEIFPTAPLGHVVRSGEPDLARSFLGVPLWTRSRFVGVLCLAGKKTGERFSKDDLSLLNTLGSQAALAIYNAQLYEAREQALLDTIAALAHAIEAKDGYTSEHCEKMTDRAVAVAQELGMPRHEIENVRLGAMLHDVGKIGIPDAVLNKSARLTPEEYEIIKQHARIGAGIVSTVKALKGVVPIVMHHQEHYDGSGYPAGLSGDAIPMGARIIGVVDTYGAMTEDRVYRKAPGHDRAVAELRMLAGRQFDPTVVDAFLDLLERRPEIGEHTQDMSQAS